MRYAFIAVVCGLLLMSGASSARAGVMANGWHEPVTPMPATSAGFMANNCGYNGYGSYIPGQYHLGTDLPKGAGTPVYALSSGTVIYIGDMGGTYGKALFISHMAGDGTQFVVEYGHVDPLVGNSSSVGAGQQIGTVKNQGNESHLHLGVRPGTGYPSSNWGMMSCGSWPNTNGFVDSVSYLNSHPAAMSTIGLISGSVVFTNSGGATYANADPDHNSWTQLSNSTTSVSASGQYTAWIDGCGAAWATSNFSSVAATQITPCNGATAIAVGSQGNLVFVDGCGSARATNTYSNPQSWVVLTGCGGAKKVAAGGGSTGRVGVINGCGRLNVTVNYQSWTQITGCGGAQDVAIGPTGTLAFTNGCGALNSTHDYTNAGAWVQITGCGGVTEFAVGSNKSLAFVDSCGSAHGTDTYDVTSSWVILTGCSGARAIAMGSGGTTGVINGCGSLNVTADFQYWTQIAPCGGAVRVAVS